MDPCDVCPCPCVGAPAFEGVAESISIAVPTPWLIAGPLRSERRPLLPFVVMTGVVVPFVCGSDLSFAGLDPASAAAVSVASR